MNFDPSDEIRKLGRKKYQELVQPALDWINEERRLVGSMEDFVSAMRNGLSDACVNGCVDPNVAENDFREMEYSLENLSNYRDSLREGEGDGIAAGAVVRHQKWLRMGGTSQKQAEIISARFFPAITTIFNSDFSVQRKESFMAGEIVKIFRAENGEFAITSTASDPDQFLRELSPAMERACYELKGELSPAFEALLPGICQIWAKLNGYKAETVFERRLLTVGVPNPEASMKQVGKDSGREAVPSSLADGKVVVDAVMGSKS